MDWSGFSGMIACAGSEPIFNLVLQEKLCKPALAAGIEISLLSLTKEDLLSGEGFIHLTSWFNFYLREDLLSFQSQTGADVFAEFNRLLGEIFKTTPASSDTSLPDNIRWANYAFNILFDNGMELRCQLHGAAPEVLESRMSELSVWLRSFAGPRKSQVPDRTVYYSYDDLHYYAVYNQDWQLVDPLHYMGQSINRQFRGDRRLHKPDIILQEDNLNRRHAFGDTWVLSADHLSTVMERPNDVSLYASICERSVAEAKRFYDDTFPYRHKYQTGNFPDAENQRAYVDYFERITTAIIFSYTAIEAFTNSFIPDGYQLIKPSGKVLDKAKIERTFPLPDKLKDVMMDIYATPDPRQESWWQQLSDLQDIRDQTIHTKQHLSKDRYSKLLAKEIFEIIQVYKTIINFYGSYILKKDRCLINEFPYSFGHDDVYPSLMSDQTYRDIYNSLHNPSNPI